MKKHKLVCVVGSPILSPLVVGGVCFSAATIVGLLVEATSLPVWTYWTVGILGFGSLLFALSRCYRLLFDRCYQPSKC